MNSKTFIGLAAVTAIAVVLAVVAIGSRPSFESSDVAGERLFPGLVNDLNRLKTVTLRHKDGTYSIDRTANGWVLRERDNYPVDAEKVDELVVKIARMTRLEAKTRLPDRYERLDLQEPDAKDSRAKEVTLTDGEGKTIAQLVVGKRKFTLGSKEGGTYVRIPGDEQTWLAVGELNPGDKVRDWLKRDIADIKDKDIRRVTVVHPDGERIEVGKDNPDDANFKILNLPKGQEPTSEFVADDFGRVLSIFLLDDVKQDGAMPWPADKAIKAEFEGFAGFKVSLDYVEADGQNWVKISATPPPAETPPADGAPAEGAPSEGAVDWAKIIAEINARAEGWVFQVPAYEVNALKKRMAELARKPESEDGT
ncbi:MAG: DUF4340 domain-containing protein [Rhodospirillaceae bacterium]|nr:DUF4340 domain-containing protein [Rhodospirillaceae bacterium]